MCQQKHNSYPPRADSLHYRYQCLVKIRLPITNVVNWRFDFNLGPNGVAENAGRENDEAERDMKMQDMKILEQCTGPWSPV